VHPRAYFCNLHGRDSASRGDVSMNSQASTTDDEQLGRLGYRPRFERSMGLWGNFALGFTYLSPVVGVYTLFSISLAAGGPPFFWSYLVVGAGQLLVCLVFCEIVSQYPITGGILPWARRLAGDRWGWLAGWVYLWALCMTIAAVAVGAAPYLAALFGISAIDAPTTSAIALALLAVSTILNLSGTRWLARMVLFGFLAELIGALAVGAYLLTFWRVQPLTVLFDTFDIRIDGSYWPALLAAGLAGIFQYYGFEACGDLAEEVRDPSRLIPRAMRMTIYVGGAAATFTCLALVLATPDIRTVISGDEKDAVATILAQAFGPHGARAVIAVVTISFVSCALSVQAAASRLLFSFGRDRMIAGYAWFGRGSGAANVPVAALLACGIAPAVVVLIGHMRDDALTAIVGFSVIGIYLAFQMVVAAALFARCRGWNPTGAFTLGFWGWPVTMAALAYGVAAIVYIAWPRTPEAAWYANYAVLLSTVMVVAGGLLYMAIGRPFAAVTEEVAAARRA
jgi:amino acid transporter